MRKLDGLDEYAARWSPVASGTSLLWLVVHLAHAEDLWVRRRFLGDAEPAPEPADRSAADAVAAYRATWTRVDPVLTTASLDDRCAGMDDGSEPPTLRWVLAHLLQETARHAGHADILRELHDGAVGR